MTASAPLRTFTPFRLGPVELRNRIVKCGTNEGMSRGGLDDRAADRMAPRVRGGRRRDDDARLLLRVGRRAHLRATRSGCATRRCPGCAASPTRSTPRARAPAIQLGHAGWFATPSVIGASAARALAHLQPARPVLLARGQRGRPRAPRAGVRRRRAASRWTPASTASRCTSGTAICSRSSSRPYNNRRRDAYGGSIENRARFPRRCCARCARRSAIARRSGRSSTWRTASRAA